MTQPSQLTGIFWMLTHCLLISIMAAMIRDISNEFHIFQIVFFHNAFAFLLLLPWAFKQGITTTVKTHKFPFHIARAILGVTSMALYFYAFTVIPLTEARAIALTGPLVSSLFAVVLLKEKTGWHRTTALIIGFLAALYIIQPGTANFSFVSLYVVSAVCMWSTIEMIIKILARSESMTTQLFYLMGLMTLFSTPLAAYVWKTPETLFQWSWLISIGAIFLVNCFAVFNAFKHADVTTIMPYDFSGMIFTAIIAFFVFDEVISTETAIGSVIIIITSVYIAKREAKLSKATKLHATALQSEE